MTWTMRVFWILLGGLFLAGIIMPFIVVVATALEIRLPSLLVWLVAGACIWVVWRYRERLTGTATRKG